MDSNIKQELIDEINQLVIKKEEDSSERCSIPHKVAKFELSTGAIVKVDEAEFSVSNDNLVQTFSHRDDHAARIYKVIVTGKSPKTTVIVKQVILKGSDGNSLGYHDLTFEFDNFSRALPFINAIVDLNYTNQ